MRGRTIAIFALGPLVAAILGVVTLPLTAWVFAPEDIGRLNIAQTLIPLIVTIVLVGLDQAYVREFHEIDDKRALFVTAAIPPHILLTALAIPVATLPSQTASILYGQQSPYLAWGTIAGLYLALLTRQWTVLARMREQAGRFSSAQILPKVVHIAGVLILLIFVDTPGFSSLLGVFLLSMLAGTIFIGAATAPHPSFRQLLKIERPLLWKLLRFGVPTVVSAFAYVALNSIGTLALRAFSDFHELGIYTIAISVGSVAAIVQSIFSTVWSPIIFRAQAEGRASSVVTRLLPACALAFGLAMSAVGVGSWIVPLILPPYYSSVAALAVGAAFAPLVYMVREISGIGLGVSRRMNLAAVNTIFSLALAVILNVVLTPFAGATGAITASVVGLWLLFVLTTETASRVWHPLPRLALHITVGACAALTVVSLWSAETPLLSVVLWACFGALLLVFFRKTASHGVKLIRSRLSSH